MNLVQQFFDRACEALGEQPGRHGMQKAVAARVGASAASLSKAIHEVENTSLDRLAGWVEAFNAGSTRKLLLEVGPDGRGVFLVEDESDGGEE